jgi:predicted TIM-barrel fold metal-dependent hydrolase
MAEEIIDVHCGWGPTPAAPTWNQTETVQSTLAERGITMACLSSLLARRYDPIGGNETVADTLANPGSPVKLRGWLVVQPAQHEESSAQMRRHLYSENFVGAALYPNPTTGEPVALEYSRELLILIRRYSKALLIETPTAEAMWHAVEIAGFMQGVKIVASGMGGEEWRAAIDFAVKPSNLFLDIAGSLAPEKIRYAIQAMSGARKLLFSSTAPGCDPAANLAMMDEAGLSSDEREKILFANAHRVFGWGTGSVDRPADVTLSAMGG